MCKYIELTTTRKQVIERFKITERDDHVFSTLEDAVRDALKRSFLDINFRTLHERSECQKFAEKLCKNPEEIESQCKFCEEYKNIVEIFQTQYWIENEKNEKDHDPTITNYLIERLRMAGFIDLFVKCFSEAPMKDEADFDKWHHNTCNTFLSVLCLYYPDAKYGKAQKIVNMMFKHLYCMNFGKDEEKDKSDWRVLNEEYFTHCHLTLDSFTLEWFHREVVDNWHDYLTDCGKNITLGKTDSWSNLQYCNISNTRCERIEKYKDEKNRLKETIIKNKSEKRIVKHYYHYMFFVDNIRQFFFSTNKTLEKLTHEQEKYKNFTPFQAEFYIWPEIQLHFTAEALFGQSIEMNSTIAKLQEKFLEKEKEFFEEDTFYNLAIAHRNHENVPKDKKEKNKTKIDNFRNYPKNNSENYDIEKEAKEIFKYLPLDQKMSILDEKIKLLKNYSKCERRIAKL